MNERMAWIENEHFKGWHCSECSWAVSAIRVDTTVAVLAFNRAAQRGFGSTSVFQLQKNLRLGLKRPENSNPQTLPRVCLQEKTCSCATFCQTHAKSLATVFRLITAWEEECIPCSASLLP